MVQSGAKDTSHPVLPPLGTPEWCPFGFPKQFLRPRLVSKDSIDLPATFGVRRNDQALFLVAGSLLLRGSDSPLGGSEEGWRGRVLEESRVGNVYRRPLGRMTVTTICIGSTLLAWNIAPVAFSNLPWRPRGDGISLGW